MDWHGPNIAMDILDTTIYQRTFGVDQMSLWTFGQDQMFCKGLREENFRGGAIVSVFPKDHRPCSLLELCGALRENRGTNLYLWLCWM